MDTPYVGFTYDTIKDQPTVHAGDNIVCPHCQELHVLKGGISDGKPSEMLLFYECGDQSYLAAVANKLIINVHSDVSGKISLDEEIMDTDPKPLCDRDCNHCPIVLHPNSRMLTEVLNDLYKHFGGQEFWKVVEGNCPNFTVCYECRMDDFCHIGGCQLAREEEA